ncbi:MAG: TonB-dependent receptor [Saprospiraceae bacterium]|nr:TonB-dependent receptor [Saprospiraceae bacterium]
MMRCKLILLLLFLIIIQNAIAENITQVIRGVVKDKDSQMELIGVNIALFKDSVLLSGAITNLDGSYRIENVPLGRYTLRYSYIGYKMQVIPNVIVNSGKEVIIDLEMEESAISMKGVEIKSSKEEYSINKMATVSAKTFSVDETNRYAGSRGDPARMASNYAGVNGADDSSNDIIVRGNSPMGILWRLENVNIPNPNHFNVSGYTGGPVGILNNKVLSNSIFMSGAFPAEYGNSIAGVFDLKMRNGNNEKHEFSGQFGFLGTEIMAEGPLAKGKKASFLVSYRYSTLDLFHALGITIGTDAIPKYQDLSFKLNFPLKNSANFSIFGIGGISNIDMIQSTKTNPDDVEIYGNDDVDEHFQSSMGVVGANYIKSLNPKTYFKATISSSFENTNNYHEKFTRHIANGEFVLDSMYNKLGYDFSQTKSSLSFLVNRKINSQHTFKTGVIIDFYQFNFADSILNEDTANYHWEQRLDTKSNTFLIQPYFQWKFKMTDRLTFHAGIHGQYLTMNESKAIEPRFGVKWQFRPSQSISLGIGMHSQMIPTYIYFSKKEKVITTDNMNITTYADNEGLDFYKSTHYVLAYNNNFKNALKLSIETYYQKLSNIPVEVEPSAYSILNQGNDLNRFFPNQLENSGTGENYGLEITIEKFFSKTYFFMISTSLYNSKYIASNGIQYDTDFNGNYIINALGTKEFKWGKKNNTSFGIGGKVTYAGGKRFTPINLTESNIVGYAIYFEEHKNSEQYKNYFRADVKINYKLNTAKLTHEIGLDLVNVFGIENVFKQTYVGGDIGIREEYQLGFLPIFYYKIDF